MKLAVNRILVVVFSMRLRSEAIDAGEQGDSVIKEKGNRKMLL